MNVMVPDFQVLDQPEHVGFSQERLERIPAFFQTYLDKKKLAGMSFLLARQGEVAFHRCIGVKDWDTQEPITTDTLFRIYSMTKPVTSVALMMLYEEGLFRLEHPVSRYIPEFADLKVWDKGDAETFATRPARNQMLIRDLLTHTSGLTYDFLHQHPVDALYRKYKIGGTRINDEPLEDFVRKVADQPLLFEPGTGWNYSVSTDICGRLVEVISGMTLDSFFEERIFQPLGMTDTAFHVPEEKLHRLSSCYHRYFPKKGVLMQDAASESTYASPPAFLSGGGGLVSTIGDYYRFCSMLLNGGTLNGHRLLSPRTVDFMTMNHLPDNKTMGDMGDSLFSENNMDAAGFGLGFSITLDPVTTMTPVSEGAFSWGGAASTYFWVDPKEEMIAIMMAQIMPSNTYPIRPQFQQLAYASLIG